MFDRRSFLPSLAGMASLGSLPHPDVCNEILGQAPDTLPDRSLYDANEESYWTEVRKLFLIPEDEIYLNNGTVGSSPTPVLKAVFEGYRDSEPYQMPEPEMWLGKRKKIRIRGGLPSKVRLSTPYYLRKKDIDRFLDACDEYRQTHPA